MSELDTNTFKQAMSQFAAGVTVITTLHGDIPIGVTATAFTSVSAEPPLVSICVGKQLFTHKVIAEASKFAVNFLSADQLDLGMIFAGMKPDIKDRFAGLDTTTAATGCPLLPDVLAWVDCEVWAQYDGGDHSIFVGLVKDAAIRPNAPLLYHNRQWQTASDLPE